MTPELPPHGIQRSTIKYVVFAGNFREFRVWQLAFGAKNGEALFVASASNLTHIEGQDQDQDQCHTVTFVKVGTFHLRSDAKEIMEYARSIWPDAPDFDTSIS